MIQLSFKKINNYQEVMYHVYFQGREQGGWNDDGV